MDRRLADMVAALCALAFASSASGVQRTFVASYGVDTNPCSVTQPCRTFAAAVAATAANGEVIVLDSAGYGPVTITQSVSIVAPLGVYAGVTVLSGDGVTVNAGPNDKVVLRGLTISGQGGTTGIVVNSGGETHIEYCTVASMTSSGIMVRGDRNHIRHTQSRGNAASGLFVAGSVQISDSAFSGNGYSGINLAPPPNGITLVATRIAADNNGGGGIRGYLDKFSFGPLNVILTDSVLSGNAGSGAYMDGGYSNLVRLEFLRSTSVRNGGAGLDARSYVDHGTPGANLSLLVVTNSSVVDNGSDGVVAVGQTMTAIIAGSTIAGNSGADIAQRNSAIVRTSQNNTLTGRGATDVVGTLTPNPLR